MARWRWRQARSAAAVVAAGAAVAMLAGCGSDGRGRELVDAGSDSRVSLETTIPSGEPTTSVSGAVDPNPKPSSDPTHAVQFSRPLTLDQVKQTAERQGATVVALWRAEPVCVPAVDGRGPPVPSRGERRLSSFAYYDADEIVGRQSMGPPATDGGWSFNLRDRFKAEWAEAQAKDVRFTGAVLLLAQFGLRPMGSEVQRSEPVSSYRTDKVQVLYLRGHEHSFAPLFGPLERRAC